MPTLTRRLSIISLYWLLLILLVIVVASLTPSMGTRRQVEAGEFLIIGVTLIALIIGIIIFAYGIQAELWGCRRDTATRESSRGWLFGFQHFIAMICALVVVPSVVVTLSNVTIIGLGFLSALLHNILNIPLGWPWAALIATIIPGYLGFALAGIPLARLLLRIAPPRPNGSFRWGAILSALVVSFLMVNMGIQYDATYIQMFAPYTYKANCATIISMFVTLGIVIPVLQRHLQPRAFLDEPYVMVLRRFSSFSDRVMTGAIMHAKPTEQRLVLMTPTHTKTGDWNPFTIALSGLSLKQPLARIPIFVRETDIDWQIAARKYIDCAQRIVIDASEDTDAIEEEIEMLKNIDRWHDVLVITQEGNEKKQRQRYNIPDNAHFATYKRNWWSTVPRAILGIFLLIFGLQSLSMAQQVVMFIAREVGGMAVLLMTPVLILNLSMLIALFVTFVYAGINRSGKMAIKKWARQPLKQAIKEAKSASPRSAQALVFSSLCGALYYYQGATTMIVILGSLLALTSLAIWQSSRTGAIRALLLITFIHLTWAPVSTAPVRQFYNSPQITYEQHFIQWLALLLVLLLCIIVNAHTHKPEKIKQRQSLHPLHS